MSNLDIKSITVHGGTFHADDVSAVALCQMAFSNCRYKRVNKVPEGVDVNAENGDIVVDIGGGIFDHHGKDCPEISEGHKHCGVTRLWEKFGTELAKRIIANLVYEQISDEDAEKIANAFEKEVLVSIAAVDNGEIKSQFRVYDFCAVVKNYNPNWDNYSANQNKLFESAVNRVKGDFTRVFERLYSGIKAERLISTIVDATEPNNRAIIVLNQFIPWHVLGKYKETRIVIFPGKSNDWNLQSVTNPDRSPRVTIPKEWWGYNSKAEKPPIKGMTFCHLSGYLAAFESREDAINAAKYIIKHNN